MTSRNDSARSPEKLRPMLYGLFSDGDVSGSGSLRDQLLAVGGPSTRTRSGIDIKAAAAAIGRSEGVVRGWLNRGTTPSNKSTRAVTNTARKAARTIAGRRAAVERARTSGRLSQVSNLSVTAQQGPVRSGQDYSRERTIHLRGLSPHQVEEFAHIYETRGDQAAMSWLEGTIATQYMDGWSIESWDADGAGVSWS